MDTSLYEAHESLEEKHWWFRGRRTVIRAFLNTVPARLHRALDIGCGTGRNALMIRDVASEVIGMEGSEEAITLARAKHPWLRVARGTLPSIPVEGTFDLITMLDVIEHVEDDRGVLVAVYEKLAPGGELLITVPAYMTLWSEHDELAHHKRRYTRKELVEKITSAGFSVTRASYFNTFLFPIILGIRVMKRLFHVRSGASDFSMPSRPINSILTFLFSSEAALLRFVSFPFGVSLVCHARKE